jgi:hypothetical protein
MKSRAKIVELLNVLPLVIITLNLLPLITVQAWQIVLCVWIVRVWRYWNGWKSKRTDELKIAYTATVEKANTRTNLQARISFVNTGEKANARTILQAQISFVNTVEKVNARTNMKSHIPNGWKSKRSDEHEIPYTVLTDIANIKLRKVKILV